MRPFLPVLLAACLALPPPVAAEETLVRGQVRPGWQQAGGSQMAGLELALAPGWKTYWRSPGEAGIPPRFDWSGSQNVASVRVHWPAPEVIDQGGQTTIGYHDTVVLPVEVQPRDPARPMVLEARMELGVCRDICVPAELALTAPLTAPGRADPAIKAALAARPRSAAEAGLTGLACDVTPIKDGLRLRAVMRLPHPGPGTEVVVIEPAEADIWVSGAILSRSGAALSAETDLVPPSGAPFALSRAGLVVTVIGPGGAVEARGCPAP